MDTIGMLLGLETTTKETETHERTRTMTHEERMKKMEKDHQARMAELRAERAEIRRKGEETRAAIDRAARENDIRFEKLKTAMNSNDFDEMTKIMGEISESIIQTRKLLHN